MPVNPFHVVKNAAEALDSVSQNPTVEVLDRDESLRSATIEFRFTKDISLSGIKGIDHQLTSAGWEEVTNESETYRTVKYKVDLAELVQDYHEEHYEGEA